MTNSNPGHSSTKAQDMPIKPIGEHWYDLTATLSRDSREEFGDWLTHQLEIFELQLSSFSTALSRKQIKSQRD